MVQRLRNRFLSHFFSLLVFAGFSNSTSGDQPVEFKKDQLKDVRDRVFAADSSGYFRLLKHASVVSATALEKAGVEVPYSDLMAHPERFRGSPITIQGVLWRLYELPSESDQGQAPLYEAWVVTGKSQPYRIVCSSLPPELQAGQKLQNIQVTGYFFLLERYEINGEAFVAPTLLAKRVVPLAGGTVEARFELTVDDVTVPDMEDLLPDIKVALHSNKDGSLARLTLGGNNLGNDNAAFERLNREILKIIGRPGNPLTHEIVVVIDSDFETQYKDLAKAVASCAGREDPQTKQMVRYIEKFRFVPPHNPKK